MPHRPYESSHRSDSGSGYWQLQLDRDLVETISAIYPEWFKSNMAEGGGHQGSTPRASPPKAVVDTSPLLNSLEQNKESLKVKLMVRRPVDQLVAQGIMPPLKAPAAYYGQRRQLERAKTGDMLKAKIQQRPPRQELERRHILESDPGHVDPSLAEKQRMLKKARLADQLNDQLSHRPGPLELIQKNILHTEEPIESAVKAGHIPYKATCEGQLNRPQHPISYINPEDDSQSSEDNLVVSPGNSDVLETAAKSAGIVVSLIPATEGTVVVTTPNFVTTIKDSNRESLVFTSLIQNRSASSPASLVSSTSTLSPLSSIASPVPSIVSQPTTPIPPPLPTTTYTPRSIQSPKSDAPGKDKNRKKSKSKSTPKTRTIKFHEYKGPPSAQKSLPLNNNNNGESSYDLLLQQQTLLLQFQLQLQHKYPQIILPAQKNQNETQSVNNPLPSPASSTNSECTISARIGKLEDMKVSDLKAELKRRNLPVSGSKPQLIERLKPFTTGEIQQPDSTSKQSDDIILHHSPPQHSDVGSPQNNVKDEPMDTLNPISPQPIDTQDQDDIVKKQQRQIEELQRELTLSQLKLKAVTTHEPKAQLLALQKRLQVKQQQQQQLAEQLHMQNLLKARQDQERIQQQQHVAFQNQKNLGGGLVLTDSNFINQLVANKILLNGHNRINSAPNFLQSTIIAPVKKEVEENVRPPPYDEATKQIKKEKNNVKSQIVDDVLEILIKNGELPPSAAQDPSTPNSAGIVKNEPVFPNNQQQPEVTSTEILKLETDFLDCPLDNMDINQLVMELAQPSEGNQNIKHETIPMDTDEWLESLLPPDNNHNNNQNFTTQIHESSDISGYDPLLGITQEPLDDPFCLEEFRSTPDMHALSWDYAS
nr:MKL/myocardin-like protein 2 isoform X2 [Onthophagus taurus]